MGASSLSLLETTTAPPVDAKVTRMCLRRQCGIADLKIPTSGFSTKELCESNSDCDKGGHCEKQLCRYPAITGKYTPVCDFSYQCPADQECTNGRCGPSSNKRSHAFTPCVFAYQCPAGFGICESMTCWRDGSGGNTDGTNANTNPDHVSGIACTFDYQCPSRYRYAS